MTSYSFAPPSAVLDGMVQLVVIPPSDIWWLVHEKSPIVAPRPGGSEIEAAELSQLTSRQILDRAARRWRESLREKVAPFTLSPDSKNTLTEDQTWHHITLAFKPTRDECRELDDVYGSARSLRFIPEEVRADEEICAVFGHVKVDGVLQPELRHITIGGSVPPKEAGRLEYDYVTTTAWERKRGLESEINLHFHVEHFDKGVES